MVRPATAAELAEVEQLIAPSAPENPYTTFVDVTHDDGVPGTQRTDRYTYVTAGPHTAHDAENAASVDFTTQRGVEVLDVKAVFRIPDDDDAWMIPEPEPEPEPVDGPDLGDAALAEAYLETLQGSTVILEGGQRATVLEFLDDDEVRVQLGDGRVEVIDVGIIERQVMEAAPDTLGELDIPDDVAELVGNAALTMAFMVIEAGIRSVDTHDGQQVIVEAPTGWFPPDADAIPLMEQASAAAVAMLIISFGMPTEVVTETITKMRDAMNQGDTNEGDNSGGDVNKIDG
jgi:hypothetical protein